MNTREMTDHLEIFCEKNLMKYFDEACLEVINTLNQTMTLLKQVSSCYKCAPQFWTNIRPLETFQLIVPVNPPITFSYQDISGQNKSCPITYNFGLHGLYSYSLDLGCNYVQILEPPKWIFYDVLVFLVLFTIAWLSYIMLRRYDVVQRLQVSLDKKLYADKSAKPSEDVELKEIQTENISEVDITEPITFDEEINEKKVVGYTSRGVNTSQSVEEIEDAEPKSFEFVEFEALLAFRGLVISLWVFFNVEGQTLSFLQKSPWDGLKMYDVRIGWFYWVLAASFYLHFHESLSQGESRTRVLLRSVLLRTVLYCAGGLCYNQINNTSPRGQDFQPEFPPISKLRVFGILQRVGLAQLVTSAVEVAVMARTVKRGPLLQDLKDSWPQWIVCGVLVAVHSSITYLLPLSTCPTGYIGPGGLYDNASTAQCTGGAAQYIDRNIVGQDRLLPVRALEQYQSVYKISHNFDPDGLLGTLTTCFLMALAMQASRIFIYFRQHRGRIVRLLCWALAQLLVAGVLCDFRQYDGPVPINHYLMSVSYVLATSGLAYLVLLGLYLLVSVWRWWSGFPFIYSGINILVVFYGSLVLHHTFPFIWEVPWYRSDTSLEYLMVAGWCVCVWNYVSYQLLKLGIVCPV